MHHDSIGPVVGSTPRARRGVYCRHDPPPKQDDGPAREAVRAFGRRSDDGLQRKPLVPVDRPGPHGWTFGYPLALVLMILTGAMLYMAFKRRRWL